MKHIAEKNCVETHVRNVLIWSILNSIFIEKNPQFRNFHFSYQKFRTDNFIRMTAQFDDIFQEHMIEMWTKILNFNCIRSYKMLPKEN